MLNTEIQLVPSRPKTCATETATDSNGNGRYVIKLNRAKCMEGLSIALTGTVCILAGAVLIITLQLSNKINEQYPPA